LAGNNPNPTDKRSNEIEPSLPSHLDIEPEVGFYILTELGDALVPDVGNAYRHDDGHFVSIFHKGTHDLEGVLDVGHDGKTIYWYPVDKAQAGDREVQVQGTKGKQGVLHIHSDGKVLAWNPSPQPSE
jgi:hypothetical protein